MGVKDGREQHSLRRTVTGQVPLDQPVPTRPHRVYVAVTNHCNRACPWCSTCSSPRGQTWITQEACLAACPETGSFEVQFEGGEPTIHSGFLDLVDGAHRHPRCARVVVVTNGVVIPRDEDGLVRWLDRLGTPLTLKLSVNHHLMDADPGLLRLAIGIRDAFAARETDRQLVLNVRLRPGGDDRDQWVVDAVEAAGLQAWANIFYLQAYGFAARRADWEAPFLVGTNFRMVNPDGQIFGPDLVARSEAMRSLE